MTERDIREEVQLRIVELDLAELFAKGQPVEPADEQPAPDSVRRSGALRGLWGAAQLGLIAAAVLVSAFLLPATPTGSGGGDASSSGPLSGPSRPRFVLLTASSEPLALDGKTLTTTGRLVVAIHPPRRPPTPDQLEAYAKGFDEKEKKMLTNPANWKPITLRASALLLAGSMMLASADPVDLGTPQKTFEAFRAYCQDEKATPDHLLPLLSPADRLRYANSYVGVMQLTAKLADGLTDIAKQGGIDKPAHAFFKAYKRDLDALLARHGLEGFDATAKEADKRLRAVPLPKLIRALFELTSTVGARVDTLDAEGRKQIGDPLTALARFNPSFALTRLTELKIDGDKASGVALLKAEQGAPDRMPVGFQRIDGAWFLKLESLKGPRPAKPAEAKPAEAKPKTGKPKIPADVEAAIQAQAKADWPDSPSMRKMAIESAREAWVWMQTLDAPALKGIPRDVLLEIKKRAVAEDPKSYASQQSSVEYEAEAYLLFTREVVIHDVPAEVLTAIRKRARAEHPESWVMTQSEVEEQVGSYRVLAATRGFDKQLAAIRLKRPYDYGMQLYDLRKLLGQLPDGAAPQPEPERIELVVRADDRFRVGKQVATRAQLVQAIKDEMTRTGLKTVVIRAPAGSPFSVVSRVFEACKAAGVETTLVSAAD